MSRIEIDEAEVRRWVKLLRSQAREDRLTAASQLGRMGVRTRDGRMVQGSLTAPVLVAQTLVGVC